MIIGGVAHQVYAAFAHTTTKGKHIKIFAELSCSTAVFVTKNIFMFFRYKFFRKIVSSFCSENLYVFEYK